MSADTLLSKLHGVKRTGPNRWIARCAAHVDRSPSLSIRELQDGRVLLKCFAGCCVASILSSVGLGWDAIMPPSAVDHRVKRERYSFNAHDVLAALADEAAILTVAALDIGHGKEISEKDRERALLASRRIRAAIDLATNDD